MQIVCSPHHQPQCDMCDAFQSISPIRHSFIHNRLQCNRFHHIAWGPSCGPFEGLTRITQFHWLYNHCIRELMSPQMQFFARIIASILIRQPTCSRAGGIWFISQSWFNAIPTIPDAHTLRHGGSCKLQPYHQHQPCKCCSLVIIIIIICRRTECERQERSDDFPQTSSS